MIGLGWGRVGSGRCAVIDAKYNSVFACCTPSERDDTTRLSTILFESARESPVSTCLWWAISSRKGCLLSALFLLTVVFALGRTGRTDNTRSRWQCWWQWPWLWQ